MRYHCHVLALAAASLLVLSSRAIEAQSRKYIEPLMASDTATFPYSEGVMIGNTLYLSGTIGLLPDDKVAATATEEAHLVLDDVKRILGEAGMTMDDLVTVQVFCSDLSAYADFNRVYRTYFKREYPARAFLGVAHVLYGARFEVQGIAVKRQRAPVGKR
jgi:2-iminobutanoate/2-iminopropanoate deaminase